MSNKESLVGKEIADHVNDLNMWIDSVGNMTIPESHKSVCDRFTRDCNILLSDMDVKESPTAADLVDFGNRCSSLEVQYNHILSDHS